MITGVLQCALAYRQFSIKKNYLIKNFFDLKKILLALPFWKIGMRFLILQISNSIFFSLGTYLTYVHMTSDDAARFDLLFKIFQMPIILFGLVLSVYWVEISRHIANNDSGLMAKRFKQLHLMGGLIILLSLIFVLFMVVPLFDIYSAGRISTTVGEALIFWMVSSVQILAYSGAVFLNAAEKLQGQLVIAISASLLLVPISVYFYSIGVGFITVPIVTFILLFPSLIYCNWIAYHEIIKKNN
jgi:O-antigen/teichoic acid export membrane protein